MAENDRKKKKEELAKVKHIDLWGSREEKYQSLLENPLGTGSFGSVYLVKDILDNKR